MYIDANKACNDLAFLLGTTAFETSIVTRSWSVRISQYDCNYSNLAPDGCTEYFYGSSTDLLTRYTEKIQFKSLMIDQTLFMKFSIFHPSG